MERQMAADRPIPRRAAHGPSPVSYSQKLMWLAHGLVQERSTYNTPIPIRMRGRLRVDALRHTLDTIVERHEVLRTTIALVDGDPVQIVNPAGPVEFLEIAVNGNSVEDREEEIKRLCEEQARRPFDHSKDMLLRAALLRVDDADQVLILMTHHIAFDGWSRKILYQEIEAIYTAYCAGRACPLPPLPIQYADFAAWQRQNEQGEEMVRQVAYWKERLSGAPMVFELPADRPRAAAQSFRGARQNLGRLPSLKGPLKALHREEGTTLFMAIVAAFGVILHRYTGQEDILIGSPILGRHRPEVEKLIGYFSNTLVLRLDLSGNPTFRELLRRVRETVLGAFENQEMPLEALVKELQPERDPSRSPVFQVMLGTSDAPTDLPVLPGLELTLLKVDRGIAKLDLSLGVSEADDHMSGTCEYSTDLFDASTIQRFTAHFRMLMESIIADPDLHIADLDMLPAGEKNRILNEWNDTAHPLPSATMHGLFEQQAARTPDAVAVECEDRTLTYGALNARANQLAHFLRSQGIGSGNLVIVCMERSLDLAVALLAVLKSGAGCVPLDATLPSERISLIAKATAARGTNSPMILTHMPIAQKLGSAAQFAVCIEHMQQCIECEPSENGDWEVQPSATAYVIFTSGSTGEPKGVLLPHRTLVNHHLAVIPLYGLTPSDRVLQFASLGFDISIEELFPTWAVGATVVFRAEDQALGGRPFSDWLSSRRITVMDLPTAFWHEWVNDLSTRNAAAPESLRLVIVGGERALSAKLAAWRRLNGDRVRWINTYGPTEASIIVTAYEPGPGELPQDLPIGKPISNTRVYVLNKHQKPVPAGVYGELYIGGAGVADGYLDDPGATAAKFVPDPFRPQPENRLYRTGDIVRFLQDGNLEFMGRADHQIKIRGFRIEPGEIEATLMLHSDISQAIVVPCNGQFGDKYLAAYVVPAVGVALTPEKLHRHAAAKLPAYMVPSSWVILSELPLNRNGKVNRAALPSPAVKALGDQVYELLEPAERRLADIWEQALGKEVRSRTDDFFDLGGHSLTAVRVLTHIEKVFGAALPLTTLFRARTLGQMAREIRDEAAKKPLPTLIPIREGGSLPPLFCVSRPNVNALGYMLLARKFGEEQPIYGLQAHLRNSELEPYTQEEYERKAAEYIAALREVQPHGPYFLIGYCEGAHIAFEMVRQLEHDGEPIGMLAILDAWPQENTRNRILFHIHLYIRQIRKFLKSDYRNQVNNLRRKLGKLIPRVSERRGHSQTSSAPHYFLQMTQRYWPGPDYVAPQCNAPITVYRTSGQPFWRINDRQLGWGVRTRSKVKVLEVPGNHRSVLREPCVTILAQEINAQIQRQIVAVEAITESVAS